MLALAKPVQWKRHSWRKSNGWSVCQDCGCRFRTGSLSPSYEWPGGYRSFAAEECGPRDYKSEEQ